MRKSMLLISALSPLAIVAALALPVAAESPGTPSANAPAGAVLDLDAIPIKPVAGPQAITGVSIDDEDDDAPGIGETEHQDRAEMEAEDDGPAGDDDRYDD